MGSEHDEFSGEPVTRWLAQSEVDRDMVVEQEFSYWDPDGKKWTAAAGATIDGASIPQPLWSIVGSPFTGDYRRASIVHDVYCIDGQPHSERRAADRMYYYACLRGGCGWLEALAHYIAVSIGGWVGRARVVNIYADSDRLARASRQERIAARAIIRGSFYELLSVLEPRGESVAFEEIEKEVDRQLSMKTEQLGRASAT